MKICFVSERAFRDGPVTQPILENDPANIAYVLKGSYYSLYTLRRYSDSQLHEMFRPFDLVLVAVDVERIELVTRIIAACNGRAATYSEGHVGDYQRVTPSMQMSFVRVTRLAAINFLYWEKYVSFYRALSDKPVEYLAYPYLLDMARRYYVPLNQKQSMVVVPSGLGGLTRNGLCTLVVAKQLLDSSSVERVSCWLDAESFEEDLPATTSLMLSTAQGKPFRGINWRQWLRRSGIDYRFLLEMRKRVNGSPALPKVSTPEQIGKMDFYRRTGWLNYLAVLSKARLLVDMNNRETVGRNALDCAALGIACVSTSHSDMQQRLFPWTTLDNSWDVDAAFAMCQRLLQDPKFYRQVVDYAAETVRQFDIPAFLLRFKAVLDAHPEVHISEPVPVAFPLCTP